MIILDMFFKLADRTQGKFNKESLEQASTDISIGFVVVQSLPLSNRRRQRFERNPEKKAEAIFAVPEPAHFLWANVRQYLTN